MSPQSSQFSFNYSVLIILCIYNFTISKIYSYMYHSFATFFKYNTNFIMRKIFNFPFN